MIGLAADENFDNDILRGLLRRKPDLDIVRVQDAGLSGASDPAVLEWAANEGRVFLTHDVSTVTRYAYERTESGQPMPGVFEIGRSVPIRVAIEDLLLIANAVSKANGKDKCATSLCDGWVSSRKPGILA